METLRNVLYKLEKAVDKCIVLVCGSMLLGITALIFIQVIFRYILQNSISWSEELTRYMMVWIVFLASGYVLSKGGHANIDMLLNRFSPKMRSVAVKGSLLLIMVFSGLVIRYGFMLMRFGKRQISSALEIPMNYVYLAIPIGGALLIFYCLVLLCRRQGEAP
ncbi:MAG: TRAP transporter small permease [Deltaproteobacteria bacterium]|nr:TRAP transporter small permease [Deltaproteobacteria bacterium]